MRLLNVHTLAFEEFVGEVGNGIPLYAILSHTWGPEEVTFKNYTEEGRENIEKKGYDKIRGCCRLAESEGFQYVWIDTCCIDKSSSAELSEAINSMFQWYRDAAICYAYLSDVEGSEDPTKFVEGDEASVGGSSFSRSRWFTRGWTLQELLAPSEVIFLASDWSEIGTKKSLRSSVSVITHISEKVLEECRWDEYSVAQKMSWAASRQTTRLEDEAYCLMGLFDVNIPLLYGEGRKAFLRLQQAIMQRTGHQSIFAWSYPSHEHSHILLSGMMAPSPEYFKDASQIEILDGDYDYQGPFEVVNQLVRLRLRLLDEIQGMKLQTYASKPSLCSVLEVQQINEGPPALDQDANFSLISELPFALEGADKTENTRSADDLVQLGEPTWRWYIYETMVIAPLRCRIGQSQLGILLSRGLAPSVGGMVKLRLHHPSIVAIDNMTARLEASTVQTIYVTISTPQEPLEEPQAIEAPSWPEIRYSSLKLAGYRAVREAGPAWVVDSKQSLIRSQEPENLTYRETDSMKAPIVLFYHQSGKYSTYPTLFIRLAVTTRIPAGALKAESSIICDLGIYSPASARSTASMVEGFRIYSADLLQDRGMEVASGHDGHSIAVRLRQGHGVFFVNVSLQKAHHERLQALQEISDTPEVRLLKTQLLPKLRSARASLIKN